MRKYSRIFLHLPTGSVYELTLTVLQLYCNTVTANRTHSVLNMRAHTNVFQNNFLSIRLESIQELNFHSIVTSLIFLGADHYGSNTMLDIYNLESLPTSPMERLTRSMNTSPFRWSIYIDTESHSNMSEFCGFSNISVLDHQASSGKLANSRSENAFLGGRPQ